MTAKKKTDPASNREALDRAIDRAQARPVVLEPPVVPPPPAGLRAAGLEVWKLCEAYDFSGAAERLILLESAARTADLVARLQAAVDADADLTVKGSMGQRVASPHLTELRQYRTQLAQLIKALGCPDDDQESAGPMSRSQVGRIGARARWGN